MGRVRFWRRIRIAPWVTLNLSKRGLSTSVGPRGVKITVGTHGALATVGVPGTGVFYSGQLHGPSLGGSSGGAEPPPPNDPGPERPLSPDRQWEWDGAQWVRADRAAAVTETSGGHGGRNLAIALGALVALFLLVIAIGAAMGPSKKQGLSTQATPSPSSSPTDSPSSTAPPTDVPAAPPTSAPAAPSPTQTPAAPPATQAPAAHPTSVALTVHITTSTYGHVAAQTLPSAVCQASATLPSGNQSTAQGLQGSKTAASDGSIDWVYKATTKTTKGTGSHTVTCSLNGQTASDSAPFTV